MFNNDIVIAFTELVSMSFICWTVYARSRNWNYSASVNFHFKVN